MLSHGKSDFQSCSAEMGDTVKRGKQDAKTLMRTLKELSDLSVQDLVYSCIGFVFSLCLVWARYAAWDNITAVFFCCAVFGCELGGVLISFIIFKQVNTSDSVAIADNFYQKGW